MQGFFDFINNPMFKTVILFVLGLIGKKWPDFTNRLIPLALLAISAVMGFGQWLIDILTPAAHAMVMAAAPAVMPQANQTGWWWFINVILVPVLVAVGAHSSGKNTIQALNK